MKSEITYLTLEEKMYVIKERIIEAAIEEYESTLNEDALEELLENDKFYEGAYAQSIGVEGYELNTFSELMNMPYEDILYIHNDIYGTDKSLNDIEQMKVCYNGSQRAVAEVNDENGNAYIVPMWMAL